MAEDSSNMSRLCVRVDSEQYARMAAKSREVGMTVSEYIRFLISLDPKIEDVSQNDSFSWDSTKDVPVFSRNELAEFNSELRKQSVNLVHISQTVNQMHARKKLFNDEQTHRYLASIAKNLDHIDECIGALYVVLESIAARAITFNGSER